MTTTVLPNYSYRPVIFGIKRLSWVWWTATAFGPYGRHEVYARSKRGVIRKARRYLKRVSDRGESVPV